MRRLILVVAVAAFALGTMHGAARADGSWADGTLMNWNTPGMTIPAAPPSGLSFADPRCLDQARPADTSEDSMVVDAGWTLYNAYQAGWGVILVDGLSGYDGMCRPVGYQTFVFVDGVFAGTISPEPMVARSDGAAVSADLRGYDRLTATLVRYTEDDPLCCPSANTLVEYRIDRTDQGPVVVPVSAFTTPTR